MYRTTHWLIAIAYYYSQLLGIIAFSYNVETGCARKKTHVTVYCIMVNLMAISIVPFFVATMEVKPRPAGQPDLHQKLYVSMILIRVIGVLMTIISNWLNRNHFIRNLNDLQHFREVFLKKWSVLKKHEDFYERRVIAKLFAAVICELMTSVGTVYSLHDMFQVKNPLILTTLGLMSTVLNVVTCHYFFVSLNVHVLFAIMAGEVKGILNSMGDLFRLHHSKRIRPGAFVTQCCRLSDALDDLAKAHRELRDLGHKINQMYYVQGCCVTLVLYMNNICLIYMGYMLAEHENLWPQFDWTAWVFLTLALFFYYTDAYLFIFLILDMLETIDMPGFLLKDRQPWLPTLDERLERSLQAFSLQMAAFPIPRHLFYLFKVTRPMVFATISSTVSNAIVLMQYDYKYSKK